MKTLEKLRNTLAKKFIPASYLESEKAEWEQQIVNARDGMYEDNRKAIAEAEAALEIVNMMLTWQN